VTNKKDLLIEIGLEEMPARFVTDSMNQLKDKILSWLADKNINFREVQSFSTPRRLAVLVLDVDETQDDIHEEAKGPAKKIALNENGEWTKAAIGFTRGQGMTVEDIYFKEISGVDYAHVNKFIEGKETKELLPEVQEIIKSLNFPKNMRWADQELRFVRPIKWLVAMFGNETVPFKITNVVTNNSTFGHRFLGEKIHITDPAQYEADLLEQSVIADPNKRKNLILEQLAELEQKNNWKIPVDPELLDEVINLVEYPTALFGNFEEEYLELPEEVLITSMKEHQRYFPVKSTDGKLLPHFVTVRNGGNEHLQTVAKGNEKVLRARLSDAAFFYREDQKGEIQQSLEKLKTIVYHEEIGTLSEKVNRVRTLTNKLAELLNFDGDTKLNADRAAEICKFDLVTNMVYEFPELQGFMGEKYALQKGEKEAVAKAINEHYMPRNAEDSTAASDEGALLAIAEKMDSIASFFAIGMIPSGSQDPYALRRQATGIVQTLIDKNWVLGLEKIVGQSLMLLEEAKINKKDRAELTVELLNFFKLRLKHVLQEKGIRYDLIDAVLGNEIGSVPSLIRKAEVLHTKKDESGFKESIEALSRILNISKKSDDIGEIKESLFENEYEKQLYSKYQTVKEALEKDVRTEEEFYLQLISMKDEINQYFDHTMIMAEDENLKQNRLNQMAQIAILIKQFANVNDIIVK
jgi:glycyl-tRNA synthetase beta chain